MKLNPLLGYLMGGIVFGGGGGGVVPPAPPTKKEINFYDFDGTLLYGLTVAEANALTALPEPPDHSTDDVPLTFQEWNYTLEQITSTATPIDVGATYITTDGKTHFKIRINNVTGGSIPFTFKKSEATDTLKIQFGADGEVLENSTTAAVEFTPATPLANGDYDVSVWLEGEGTFSLGSDEYEGVCVGLPGLWRGVLMEVRIGQNARLCQYSFETADSLRAVTVPIGAWSSAEYGFSNEGLVAMIVPRGTEELGGYAFAYSYALRMVSLPLSLTALPESGFNWCTGLSSVVVPSGVAEIGESCFEGCVGVFIHDFSAFSSIPELDGSDVFQNINDLCQIKVPSALVDTWKAADYWSDLADYIVGV